MHVQNFCIKFSLYELNVYEDKSILHLCEHLGVQFHLDHII